MPDLLLYAFVAVVILIVLFVVLAVVLGGLRPKKGGAPGRSGGSSHTDMHTS